jgi:hypothetical protein
MFHLHFRWKKKDFDMKIEIVEYIRMTPTFISNRSLSSSLPLTKRRQRSCLISFEEKSANINK